MFSLKDKVALVTGASQGIGRATSLALAEAGATVAIAARNTEKLASLAAEIAAAGGEALAVPMDVADPAQVKTGFQQLLAKLGKLDILVNNAAITRDTLAPVSYTHLDVYKRQQVTKPAKHSSARSPLPFAGSIPSTK